MRKALAGISLAVVAAVFAALPVLGAYTLTITVTETSGASHANLPVIAPMDNASLAANHYITSSGRDVRVSVGGSNIPFILADNLTAFVIPTQAASTSTIVTYTTGNTAADYQIVPGEGGYVITPDNPSLEPSSASSTASVEVSYGEIGAAGPILAKAGALSIETTGTEINAYIEPTATLSAPGITPGTHIVNLVTDANGTVHHEGGNSIALSQASGTAGRPLDEWGQSQTGERLAELPPANITSATFWLSKSNNSGNLTGQFGGLIHVSVYEGDDLTTGYLGTLGSLDPSNLDDLYGGNYEPFTFNSPLDNEGHAYIHTAGGDPVSIMVQFLNDAPVTSLLVKCAATDVYDGGEAVRSYDGTLDRDDFSNWPDGFDLVFLLNGVELPYDETSVGTAQLWVDGIKVDEQASDPVPDTNDDIVWMSDATPYLNYVIISIDGTEVLHYEPNAIIIPGTYGELEGGILPDRDGTQDGLIVWGTNAEGIDVGPPILTPDHPAQAPPYDPGDTTGQLFPDPTATGDFGTGQLLHLTVALTVILCSSLGISAIFHFLGTSQGSLFFKSGVVVGLMGIFAAIRNTEGAMGSGGWVDLWMIIFFVFLALALMFASKQLSV